MTENVAILGASKNKSRYSNKAQKFLIESGHTVIPINPKYNMIDGVKCYPDLLSYPQAIDTVTVYVKPSLLASLVEDIIQVSPYRVILNPGTHEKKVIDILETAGIKLQMECTLVLLRTGQF